MNSSNMKNMIVLKNLPSNLIEEAIVVLKNNITIKVPNTEQNRSEKQEREHNKEYIVKEAEMHICQYVSHMEDHKKTKNQKELEKKYIKTKKIAIFFGVLAVLSMIVNFLK